MGSLSGWYEIASVSKLDRREWLPGRDYECATARLIDSEAGPVLLTRLSPRSDRLLPRRETKTDRTDECRAIDDRDFRAANPLRRSENGYEPVAVPPERLERAGQGPF